MIKVLDGVTVTMWCSLLCSGNEATGDLVIEDPPGTERSIPICEECLEKIKNGASPYRVDTLDDGVVE